MLFQYSHILIKYKMEIKFPFRMSGLPKEPSFHAAILILQCATNLNALEFFSYHIIHLEFLNLSASYLNFLKRDYS